MRFGISMTFGTPSMVVSMLQTCQVQSMWFTHSAFVWQSCAEPSVDCAPASGTGLQWPAAAMSWHSDPADAAPAELLATPQQTWPLGQSLASRHLNWASWLVQDWPCGMQDPVWLRATQHVFDVRLQATLPHSGTPASLNTMFDSTRPLDEPEVEPLLEPEPLGCVPLDELEPPPPLDPDELEPPPELDPLELDASSESSPDRALLPLLPHPGADTETSAATAHGATPRSHGYRRAASRRGVM